MKLMRTSDGGFAYSSSRLSSLWLPECSKAPLRLCKTVQFSCLLKGVHRWLNTPRWPYQLFHYSRRGPLWTRWQKHIFGLKIKRESQPPFGGLMLGDYAKTLGGVSNLRVNKERFDRAAEVTALPRSLSKSIFPPHFLPVKTFPLRGWWDDYVSVHGETVSLRTKSLFFIYLLTELQ